MPGDVDLGDLVTNKSKYKRLLIVIILVFIEKTDLLGIVCNWNQSWENDSIDSKIVI